jgi:RNA polymerase sigma-70 factor, ECF subfamily
MKSDNELLHDFRRGDRTAFDKLVRRHHVTTLNFFHLLLASEKQACELTARVFLYIYNDTDEFRGEAQFLLYLYRAAYACWTDHLRREGTPSHALPPPLQTENSAEPATQTRNISDSAVVIRNVNILSLLERLPNELRLLLVLHEFCGLSYVEMSRVIDISQEAVKRRIAESFKYLRAGIRTTGSGESAPPAPPLEQRSMGVGDSGSSTQTGNQPK